MDKTNSHQLEERSFQSPKGTFGSHRRSISLGLGRDPFSTDLHKQHPFDVEITRIEPGKGLCPFHSHSAQWEFYLVLSGEGTVRDDSGSHPVRPGDAFLFKPGEAHQLTNAGTVDFVFYVIADNPPGETCHYPDSGKYLVRSPGRRLIRSENLDYFDGEE